MVLRAQSRSKNHKPEKKDKVWFEQVFLAVGSPGTEGRGKQDSSWYVVVMLCNRDVIESRSLRWG